MTIGYARDVPTVSEEKIPIRLRRVQRAVGDVGPEGLWLRVATRVLFKTACPPLPVQSYLPPGCLHLWWGPVWGKDMSEHLMQG